MRIQAATPEFGSVSVGVEGPDEVYVLVSEGDGYTVAGVTLTPVQVMELVVALLKTTVEAGFGKEQAR